MSGTKSPTCFSYTHLNTVFNIQIVKFYAERGVGNRFTLKNAWLQKVEEPALKMTECSVAFVQTGSGLMCGLAVITRLGHEDNLT